MHAPCVSLAVRYSVVAARQHPTRASAGAWFSSHEGTQALAVVLKLRRDAMPVNIARSVDNVLPCHRLSMTSTAYI